MDEWTMYDVADPRNGTWNRCWGANPDGSGGRYGRMPCPNETFAWQDPPMFFRNKTQTERLNNQMAADWTPQLPVATDMMEWQIVRGSRVPGPGNYKIKDEIAAVVEEQKKRWNILKLP